MAVSAMRPARDGAPARAQGAAAPRSVAVLGTVAAALLLAPAAAPAAERRCGWLENPTPANVWLTDREGPWILSAQGGHQAEGMEALGDPSRRGWVATNGSYGHGCACILAEVDRAGRRVPRVVSAEPLPLARCRADPDLPRRRAGPR